MPEIGFPKKKKGNKYDFKRIDVRRKEAQAFQR